MRKFVLVLTIFIVGCGGINSNEDRVPYHINPKTGKYKTIEEQGAFFPVSHFMDEEGVEWDRDESVKPTLGESLFGKGFDEKNYHWIRRGTTNTPNFGD